MDFNSISVSSNLLPNSMPMPSCPLPRYRQKQIEEEKLRLFWQKQLFNIQAAEASKNHQQLPLARIRRIMKSDAEVQMLSAETPMLMAKACEIFIRELTFRAWMRAEESNKRILQPCDIANTIMQTHAFHFLTHLLPTDILPFCAFDAKKEENAANIAVGSQTVLPYPAGFMGNPVMNMGSDMVARKQMIPQPLMMQPPFMPFDHMPYNSHPKIRDILLMKIEIFMGLMDRAELEHALDSIQFRHKQGNSKRITLLVKWADSGSAFEEPFAYARIPYWFPGKGVPYSASSLSLIPTRFLAIRTNSSTLYHTFVTIIESEVCGNEYSFSEQCAQFEIGAMTNCGNGLIGK
ncbi:hypothetical protein VNO77_21641 [Canavalia gladiata]|uniref:Transcription factor CBF/NF-Y/archaeal histone domain-containing protein n=1 Tax=Canavalia gladiata TaxID=3824 RepID=A0AAN9QRS9_CANGL